MTEADRQRAAEQPPHPVPFHCKPWLDGQSAGWTLLFGYRAGVTLRAGGDGRLDIVNKEALAAEAGGLPIRPLAAGQFFEIVTSYRLSTEPSEVCLLIAANRPPTGLELAPSLWEANRPGEQLRLAFRWPAAGSQVALDAESELARVILLQRRHHRVSRALAAAEQEALNAREAAYLAAEQATPSRWQAANGETFTHLYKEWSARLRRLRPEANGQGDNGRPPL
ncbi:MAG: hypothetical protein ACRDHL_09390 [Candidatus Promineifilaceae bacterium]